MFAVVDDEQELSRRQGGHELVEHGEAGFLLEPTRLRDSLRNQARVSDPAEFDQPDTVLEVPRGGQRELAGQARLAAASHPGQVTRRRSARMACTSASSFWRPMKLVSGRASVVNRARLGERRRPALFRGGLASMPRTLSGNRTARSRARGEGVGLQLMSTRAAAGLFAMQHDLLS
jgi:hypothetical protein